jgi:hypothetical protein
MAHPAAKKRGADSQVPAKSKARTPRDATERKLEQGLVWLAPTPSVLLNPGEPSLIGQTITIENRRPSH